MTPTLTFHPSPNSPLNKQRVYLGDEFIGEIGPWLSDDRTFGGVRAWWRTYLNGECETRGLRFSSSIEKAKAALEKHVAEWAEGRGAHGG
jgi:hypothetical protein